MRARGRGSVGGRDRGPAVPRAARSQRRPDNPVLRLSIPSETSFLALVRDMTKKMAGHAGFDDGTADRMAVAVGEATTNVIEHAYRGISDREVELRFDDRGPEFRVDVLDTGATVDPRTVPRVDLERYASERRTGGLGVHLMEKIMDSVTFGREARRNVCCLVKRKETAGAGGG